MNKLYKKNIENIFALTPMQEGMLSHYLLSPTSDHYVEQLILILRGEVSLEYFKMSWDHVIKTNSALRSSFRWKKLDKPTQLVLKKYNHEFKFHDLSCINDDKKRQNQLTEIIDEDRDKKFDLRQIPFRIILCKISNLDYCLIISNHHIIFDGWSTGIILKEFFQNYALLEKGNSRFSKDIKPDLNEFIRWYQKRDKDKQKKYWEDYLHGFSPQISIPIKRKGTKQISKSTTVKEFSFNLDKNIKESLEKFVKDCLKPASDKIYKKVQKRFTSAAVFNCAWGLLLQKYCGTNDVVFGTTVSGRSAPIGGIEHMVGLFINTLPQRITSRIGDSILDVLLKINEDLLNREKFENTPLTEIKQYSQLESQQELFDSLLVIENYPLDHFLSKENNRLPLKVLSYSTIESTPYDLNISVSLNENVDIRIIYCNEDFKESAILRLSQHFICILKRIIWNSDSLISEMDILSIEEKKQLLLAFNEIGNNYSTDKTLHGLFLEQVKRTPDQVALVDHNYSSIKKSLSPQDDSNNKYQGIFSDISGGIISITYNELDQRSGWITQCLLDRGVIQGNSIGLFVDRSIEMMVGILGILKAGCTYLPLNPKAPDARTNYILKDSRVKLVLSDRNEIGSEDYPVSLFDLSLISQSNSISESYQSYQPPHTVHRPAYIIYTSGSTGNPKGVLVSHSNFSQLVHWGYQFLEILPSDRFVQSVSYYFDWSVWEIFIALTRGASLYLEPEDVLLDAERNLNFIYGHAITVLHITPTHLQSLLHVAPGNRLSTLACLCIGGENLSCDLVERIFKWMGNDCRLINMYGPTETTIMSSALEVHRDKLLEYRELSGIPIGKTLGNNVLFLLDRNFKLTPLYIPGELYIGGDGVTPGYLNRPELTNERFLTIEELNGVIPLEVEFKPLIKKIQKRKRFYKTGDLARWLPDGILEFLGRIDFQVKIRGYRIEPGEIEKNLLEHPEIKDVLVTARKYENGDKYLCSYIVPQSSKSTQLQNTLKDYLSGRLPDYMVPAYFVTLDRFPLNPNGKVDLKALPGPLIVSGSGYRAAVNSREKALVKLWGKVLDVEAESIGIDDDFFRLGGHSLNVTALISRISKELNVEIPFVDFFINPTIRELAVYINKKQKSKYGEILPVEEKEYYPLSAAQRRLFILQQMELSGTAYNINRFFKLEIHPDREKLEKVFLQLISRHESFRTSFEILNEEPVQKIHNQVNFVIEYFDINSYIGGRKKKTSRLEDIKEILDSFIRPFNLSSAPLLRVGLLILTGGDSNTTAQTGQAILMVDLHHIIADGSSIEVLTKDIKDIYEGKQLSVPWVQYKEYSEWQRSDTEKERTKNQEDYWIKVFSGDLPTLHLPTDYPRPVIQNYTGNTIEFEISTDQVKGLKELALHTKSTLFMVILAIYNIFLSKISGQEDIVVGTPVKGRRHVGLEKIMGMFVNTLAIRDYPSKEKQFHHYLNEVKENALRSFENQDYPYEDLVEKIAPDRDTSRNPLFDVLFVMQNRNTLQFDIPGLTLSPYKYDNNTAKFDLTLMGIESEDQLLFSLEYSKKLFTKTTIERFILYFKKIIYEVINAGELNFKLSVIQIIGVEEKKQILFDFNETETIYPGDKTIHRLFEARLGKYADRIAVDGYMITNNKSGDLDPRSSQIPLTLTYSDLNRKSNALALSLKKIGVAPDSIVGILMEPSVEMVVGIFGILKAGGAYLPLDPGYPLDRIEYILKDSGAKILMSTSGLKEKIERIMNRGVAENSDILFLDTLIPFPLIAAEPTDLTLQEAINHQTVNSLAYIIYTSGTTGKPKGVLVNHSSAVNLLIAMQRCYPLRERDVYLLKTSYVFDVSVTEMFGWFFGGGGLAVLEMDGHKDPLVILETIVRKNITHINFVPSMFHVFLEHLNMKNVQILSSLKYIFLAGEKLIAQLVTKFRDLKTNITIENIYGPTESTVYASRYSISNWKGRGSIPIGKPMTNLKLYVLNKNEQLQPVGILGELYIFGIGVARGYLNRPELTAEKFKQWGTEKRIILYRTGDLVKWLSDGNIELLGRIDHQVKIRGFRIELGEIESALINHEYIKEAVVLSKVDENGNDYLMAYFVSIQEIHIQELKNFLLKSLPEYMVPSYFLKLERIPLTITGKIDRRALPVPKAVINEGYIAPQNPIEEKLTEIWANVLGKESLPATLIGIDDNFFHLGGHSLKATLLSAKVHREFGVKLSLLEVFKSPTIRKLGKTIKEAIKSNCASLESLEKKEYYPLSSAQMRLFVLQQMDEHGAGIAYNIPSIWLLTGIIEIQRLEDIFGKIIRRHESLRSSFGMINETAVQMIHDQVNFSIENYKMENTNHNQMIGGTQSHREPLIRKFIRPFNLAKAPLLRVGLVELPEKNQEDQAFLIIDFHHIVTDGLSIDIFAKEFMSIYSGKQLSPLKVQYKDYVQWQEDERKKETGIFLQQGKYWREQFLEEIPLLELPIDFPRPLRQCFEGKRIGFAIPKAQYSGLKSLALEQGATLYMVLLAIFNIFLSKLANQETIVVGTVAAGRRNDQLEAMIGMFVNTLVLVNYPLSAMTFKQFLRDVKEKTLQGFENQDFPFEELVKSVDVRKDPSRNPLFDVLFDLQPINIDKIDIADLKMEPYDLSLDISKFDLILQAIEEKENLGFKLEFSTRLFKEETIGRFIEYFKRVIEVILERPGIRLSQIEMVSENEKKQILSDINDTEANYPINTTIQTLFEEQVYKTPDYVALTGSKEEKRGLGEIQLSYQLLNEKSNNLAFSLSKKGIQADRIVGIMMDPSVNIIIGFLGILKAGGVYMPIDPDYPDNRREYMLEDSDAKLFITDSSLTDLLENNSDLLTRKPMTLQKSSNLAYVIYTSGTTGRPKGVLIEHENVVRLMFNDKFQFEFNERDIWTMFHSYCFDFSVWEMYGALLRGGKLVMITKPMARNTQGYLELLKREKVTILNQTPSAFYNLMKLELSDSQKRLYIRYVIFGGEALAPVQLKEWKIKYPTTKLINMYGITETTVHVTFKEIGDIEIESAISNIGKPIPTLSVYILDRDLNLLPIGVAGELVVGGKGVGRGYLNRPELTVEKFITRPIRLHERLYRSGDLAKITAARELEYLGRIDKQVKIRGFRIELGEIENHLLTHEEIKSVVVLPMESHSGDTYLCAYFVAIKEIPESQLKTHLAKKCPDYMIPSFFVLLEQIPLTPNGKIDRKALPIPNLKPGLEYTGPRNEIEEQMVFLWADILDIEAKGLGIDADFFELGGHSLKAALLVARIHNAFDVDIPLTDIFISSTIRGLAELILKRSKDRYISINSIEKREYYSLSSAQRRLYVLHQIDPQGVGYNIPAIFTLKGKLQKEQLEKAFLKLVQRHESLRTSFHLKEEEPVQKIHEYVNFKIENFAIEKDQKFRGVNKETLFETFDFTSETKIRKFIRPFDLSNPPLFRVGLIEKLEENSGSEIQEKCAILMIDMHHIVSDGTSMNILAKDFMDLYNEMLLPEPRNHYKEFSEWQRSDQQLKLIKKQKNFWLKEFLDEIPVLDLPNDYIRPVIQDFSGNTLKFEFQQQEFMALKSLALKEGVTLYMILLSMYVIFLSKLSNQEDLVVGTPVAGRRHTDLEEIIGMFVNTLALRNFPLGNKRFKNFLQDVKARTLKAFENQDYQYEELVEHVAVNKDASRNPLFDTMFVLQNINNTGLDISGLKLSPHPYNNKISKFDLTLSAAETGDKLLFAFEYCTKLFSKVTIERFINYFKKIVLTLSNENSLEFKLSELEIISLEEKRQILFDFNHTDIDYPQNDTLYHLFENQVKMNPDRLALFGHSLRFMNDEIGEYQTTQILFQCGITYSELNYLSNLLANDLKDKGVDSDKIVGIQLKRTVEMVIGMMSILKAGGAYLPIDPEYPGDRIDYMLKDSGAQLLVTSQTFASLSRTSFSTSQLTNFSVFPAVEIQHTVNTLAYVIYTSGTTGKPKGVLVDHKNGVNVVTWFGRTHGLDSTHHVLQISDYIFDASVNQIFGTLIHGAVLYIVNKDLQRDPMALRRYIQLHLIHLINFVPSFIHELLCGQDSEILPSLETVISGAEKLDDAVKDKIIKMGYRLCNQYGPTETTIDALAAECSEQKVNLGKPIANAKCYIVDPYFHLQPVGIPGELLVAGTGVTRGYLNNPELTFEKFCFKPSGEHLLHLILREISKNQQKRLILEHSPIYRTGDLALWLPDGNVKFLGRIDYQVKIRGFRIELGEIENRLLEHPEINQVVVLDKIDESENSYLAAYFVSNQTIPVLELREYLLKQLPDYMVPEYFTPLEKIPITPTGKIDRKVLPEPEPLAGVAYVSPRNFIEEKLAEIWAGILGRESLPASLIGIDDNFFRLGGHSLKATLLISRIYKELKVKFPLTEVFKRATIRGMGEFIKKAAKHQFLSIKRVEEKEYYPLSSAQKRLYVLQQMDLENTGYHMPAILVLHGELRKQEIPNTFWKLIQRHESFRTSFEMIQEEPFQRIHKSVEFDIEYYEKPESATEETAKSFIRPFLLSTAPLLRVGLVKNDGDKHIMMIDMHHIIGDGISISVLIKDFASIFNGQDLPAYKVQYRDFSCWQNNQQQIEFNKQKEEYWVSQMAGELPVLNLPTDYMRPMMQSFEGAVLNFEIFQDDAKALKKLAFEKDITLYMLLLSIYFIFLSKLSNQEDIIVGTPVAGRRHTDIEEIIGMFINTLAIRDFPLGDKSVCQFLQDVKENTLRVFENQDYQYEDLVEKVSVNRDTSRNPLFDTMFVLQNMETTELNIPGFKIDPYKYENKTSKFDLTLFAVEKADKILLTFEYCIKLFSQKTIERFIIFFKKVIDDILKSNQSDIKLSAIEVITAKEKKQLLFDFNYSEKRYPGNKTIQQLFEEQLDKSLDRIALLGQCLNTKEIGDSPRTPYTYSCFITYKEFNQQSNRLANYLTKEACIKQSFIVGIMMERSLEMVIGILGILKAGGAYLPLDPEYPEDRIQYILKDSGTKVLLTAHGLKSKVETMSLSDGMGNINTLYFDSPATTPRFSFQSSDSPKISGFYNESLVNTLAYIIYTSGSTGKPKGVLVDHSSAVNLLYAMQQLYPLGETDAYLLKTSYIFDVSVTEFFGWFLGRGKLAVLEMNGHKDPLAILNTIARENVTHINFVPSMFNVFLEQLNQDNVSTLSGLKYILLAGEKLLPGVVDRFKQLNTTILLENIYGPTENTVYASYYSLSDWKENGNIPIGKPFPNVKLYVFDKNGHVQPMGIAGELCIKGSGVARGYLNRPELTADKFNHRRAIKRDVLYRTGDLVKWLSDGNIEFLGRIDHQVKIRGFRIELEEIEKRLLIHEDIKEAIVLIKMDESGGGFLVAYFVSKRGITDSELREFLLKSLPDYMVPAYFLPLEMMPLTPSGKIDRKSLPEPSVTSGEGYVAPHHSVEKKLTEIYAEVLGRESLTASSIGIDDNFFQLGGHSLKAAVLIAKIHKVFDQKISMTEIFKTPTIRGIANYLKNVSLIQFVSIQPVETREYYHLSSAQKRMFFLNQMGGINTTYNITFALKIQGSPDKDCFERVFQQLINRHESLRTSFDSIEGIPTQIVHDSVDFYLEVKSINSKDNDPLNHEIEKSVIPFRLDHAPLLKVVLINLPENENLLLFEMHHIISDGMSMSILVKEFIDLYKGNQLPPLPVQYKDFAQWQNALFDSNELKSQEEYWVNQLRGEIPVINLSTDYSKKIEEKFAGSLVSQVIDKDLTQKIKNTGSETQTTLYIILLSVFNILLSKYAEQEDIIVGTTVSGRTHQDLNRIVGMFVNTLAIRNYPEGRKYFKDFLTEVKENVLQAFENQDYPFEELVNKLNIRPQLGRNPLFDVAFTFNNIEFEKLDLDEMKIQNYEFEKKISHFDMVLHAAENNEMIHLNLEYSTALFKKTDAELILDHFTQILNHILEDSEIILKDINIGHDFIIPETDEFEEKEFNFA